MKIIKSTMVKVGQEIVIRSYAKIAKNEGFEQITEVFLVTAENEKEHAHFASVATQIPLTPSCYKNLRR